MHSLLRETIDFMQSGGIGGVGSGKIYLGGAGVGGARICHAGREICAPAARGRERARAGERRQRGGEDSRLPREDAPSWHGYGCFPIQRGDLPQRHAPSRRLRHRPGAHHRLLPRHRQRQRMLQVPERYQQGCSLRLGPLRRFFFCQRIILRSKDKAVSATNTLLRGKKKLLNQP